MHIESIAYTPSRCGSLTMMHAEQHTLIMPAHDPYICCSTKVTTLRRVPPPWTTYLGLQAWPSGRGSARSPCTGRRSGGLVNWPVTIARSLCQLTSVSRGHAEMSCCHSELPPKQRKLLNSTGLGVQTAAAQAQCTSEAVHRWASASHLVTLG